MLSIGIPTYNRPQLLGRCLSTILPTAGNDCEILVADNSESEETSSLIPTIEAKYGKQIRYLRKQYGPDIPRASRQAHNVNALIANATQPFIYIIHDDDYALEGGVDAILAALRRLENRYQVLKFGVRIVDIGQRIKRDQTAQEERVWPMIDALKELLGNSSFIRTPAMVVSAAAYARVGNYAPERGIPLDFDMWSRLLCEFDLYESAKKISAYTVHNDSETMRMFNQSNLELLLDIFDIVQSRDLLDPGVFKDCKGRYFNQWILAGAYRSLTLSRDWNTARSILDLYEHPAIRVLPVAAKQRIVRTCLCMALLKPSLIC